MKRRRARKAARKPVEILTAHGLNARAARGWLVAGAVRMPCAFGRGGRRAQKREGDGATPRGRFGLLILRFRLDRTPRPGARLPCAPLQRCDLWCDDPASGLYNRPARAPLRARHERLWRDDGLYDMLVVLDYNLRPRMKGAGSAIFLHCARPGWEPTEGCVAIAPADMRRLLPRLGRAALLVVR
jgi:L,D-peptidoglycan transpeptidase YkuD (ErfK/YbiS/YcfS/YnhG family)